MKIICISGKAQHGKDTVAGMLRTQLEADGYRVLVIHYADLLKYVCRTFFGWDGAKDQYGRQLLQYVGTEVVRKKRPDFWVDFVTEVLTLFPAQWDYVLIPDCRFPNEIEAIRNAGFCATHLRVVRRGFDSPLTPAQQLHPSETALDDCSPDYCLSNHGTLSDLHTAASDWLANISCGIKFPSRN